MRMTHVLVLLVCVFAGVVNAQREGIINLPPAAIQTALGCMAETGVNPEILPQLLNPSTYDRNGDKRVHKFVNCTFAKMGYAKKNGHVRIDRVLEIFPKDIDNNKRAALKKVMEECNKESGNDVTETTYKIFGCFVKNSPIKLSSGL